MILIYNKNAYIFSIVYNTSTVLYHIVVFNVNTNFIHKTAYFSQKILGGITYVQL